MRGYYLNVNTIIKISRQLKNQGRDVVFTHGCFDLMHAGHLLLIGNRAVDFVFLIKGKMPWADSYYLDLYKKINPMFITYGNTFGYKKRLETRKAKLKGINFVLIDELPLDIGSTSKIINKVLNLPKNR